MQSIANRSTKKTEVADFYLALMKKIEVDAQSTERILEALKDGEIDRIECRKIGSIIEKVRVNLTGLEKLLHSKIGELDESSNIRVM